MKKEADGFYTIEDDDDWTVALVAMNKNIILLHERIEKLEKRLNGTHD